MLFIFYVLVFFLPSSAQYFILSVTHEPLLTRNVLHLCFRTALLSNILSLEQLVHRFINIISDLGPAVYIVMHFIM